MQISLYYTSYKYNVNCAILFKQLPLGLLPSERCRVGTLPCPKLLQWLSS